MRGMSVEASYQPDSFLLLATGKRLTYTVEPHRTLSSLSLSSCAAAAAAFFLFASESKSTTKGTPSPARCAPSRSRVSARNAWSNATSQAHTVVRDRNGTIRQRRLAAIISSDGHVLDPDHDRVISNVGAQELALLPLVV